MSKKSRFIACLFVSLTPFAANAGNACFALEEGNAPVSLLFDCLKQQTENILELQSRNRELEVRYRFLENTFAKQVASISSRQGIPRGMVAAFDLPGGCPDGWTRFQRSNGRFIVGVGEGNKDISGNDLRNDFDEVGGEESVTLTVEQMPIHTHDSEFDLVVMDRNHTESIVAKGEGTWGRIRYHNAPLSAEGAFQPHNNMPPYIALYYCKKD